MVFRLLPLDGPEPVEQEEPADTDRPAMKHMKYTDAQATHTQNRGDRVCRPPTVPL